MRVAVTQFATSLNINDNLATCIRMIKEAAVCKPSLIILPEFCNTQFVDTRICNAPYLNILLAKSKPCYEDHNQAWDQALAVNGVFLQNISEQAKEHNCYIVLNVTLRRDDSREHKNGDTKSNITITSCLFSPEGDLIQQSDKQMLVGQEHDFFISSNKSSEIVSIPSGKIALLAANDDITFEAPRRLALNGVQLLCHSMSSFVLDQCNIHGPTRASENKVFLASANKVGLLVPEEFTLQGSNQYERFVGVGQSQIVSPEGKILAKLAHNEEGFIFADIALPDAINNVRPDGTELFKQRRPELYETQKHSLFESTIHENKVPATVNAVIFATYTANKQAIDDVCHYIENNLSDIIQLPELFFIADKNTTNNVTQRSQIECLSTLLIRQISAELRPFQYVCTSLIIEDMHQAVIISDKGVFATQQQLHFCKRYEWTALGNALNIIALPLEQGHINVAMLTADDANIPEIVNLAALQNTHVLLVPFDIQESSEVSYSLVSRAAEHKICIVAASREKSFTNNLLYEESNTKNDKNVFSKNKIKPQKSTGFIANLATNSALITQWKSRKFTNYLNQPLIKYQHGKITKAVIYPIAACNKVITDEFNES